MNRHLFVSKGRDDIPRWSEAFPGARQCSPQQVRAQAGAGDHVWIMTDIEDWPGLTERLVQRGAILVALSHQPNATQAFQALNAGARGYAHALSAPALLRQVALVTVNQGLWVWPELLRQVVGSTYRALGGASQANTQALACLTARERDVALAVAAGNSNKEVARKLEITERTVKAHLGAVFRKLRVRDRMQLILTLSGQEASVTS
ncbi:regulatory protein, luxR family [Modicisalibacter muralis]|uniref:Regulatory protein, luxR family n=1 Tax=Modicisalibacter muralis TaxID=119000 RepID=A0A1G9FB50_9GAMM|nr:response regulator transcription factor [Halomonas muralis]SDK85570.1 regulatory protein, luxR family [Halomonas muralis]